MRRPGLIYNRSVMFGPAHATAAWLAVVATCLQWPLPVAPGVSSQPPAPASREGVGYRIEISEDRQSMQVLSPEGEALPVLSLAEWREWAEANLDRYLDGPMRQRITKVEPGS